LDEYKDVELSPWSQAFGLFVFPFVMLWVLLSVAFMRTATVVCGVAAKWWPFILCGVISGMTAMCLMWAISYYFDLV
jgi:hypothetical protein